MGIQSITLERDVAPATAALLEAETRIMGDIVSRMMPGRADPDRVQHFDKAELKEALALQCAENRDGCPADLRTPPLPQQSGKTNRELDAATARLAATIHKVKTGEESFIEHFDDGIGIAGIDRRFGGGMEVSAFLRGRRAVANRAHHYIPDAIIDAPLAICEHAFGFVVVIYDDEMDPDVEHGSPTARFGTIAECDAFIAGVRSIGRAS